MCFQRTLLFSFVISAGALGCHSKRDASQGSDMPPPRTMEGTGNGAEPPGDGSIDSPYGTGTPGAAPSPSGTTTGPPGTPGTGNADAHSPGYHGASAGTGMATDGGIGGYRDAGGIGGYRDAGIGDGGIGDGGIGDGGIGDGGIGDGGIGDGGPGSRPRRGRASDAGS